MKTKLKTVHEESYSDNSRTIGILLNYSLDVANKDVSYVYIYRDNMYIIFDTIIDTIDYLLYGEKKMKRSYLPENEFDSFYDADYIEGELNDYLTWTTN